MGRKEEEEEEGGTQGIQLGATTSIQLSGRFLIFSTLPHPSFTVAPSTSFRHIPEVLTLQNGLKDAAEALAKTQPDDHRPGLCFGLDGNSPETGQLKPLP